MSHGVESCFCAQDDFSDCFGVARGCQQSLKLLFLCGAAWRARARGRWAVADRPCVTDCDSRTECMLLSCGQLACAWTSVTSTLCDQRLLHCHCCVACADRCCFFACVCGFTVECIPLQFSYYILIQLRAECDRKMRNFNVLHEDELYSIRFPGWSACRRLELDVGERVSLDTSSG